MNQDAVTIIHKAHIYQQLNDLLIILPSLENVNQYIVVKKLLHEITKNCYFLLDQQPPEIILESSINEDSN
jgi:hypothetical protein